MNRIFIIFSLVFIAFSSLAEAAVLSPTTDGSILDGFIYNVGFVSKDGIPDQLDGNQSVEVFNRTLVEKHGIMEFGIAGLGEPVLSAFLQLTRIDSLGPYPLHMQIFGYAGNGGLDSSDYSAGTLLSSFAYSGTSTSVFDVREFIKDLKLNHADYAGFNLRILDVAPLQPGTPYVAFGSLDDYPPAQLFVNQNPPVVPEPASGLLFLTGLAGLVWRRKSVRS